MEWFKCWKKYIGTNKSVSCVEILRRNLAFVEPTPPRSRAAGHLSHAEVKDEGKRAAHQGKRTWCPLHTGITDAVAPLGLGCQAPRCPTFSAALPHPTWCCVLQDKVFIIKLLPVDRLPAGTVVVGEISSLAHELGDNSVKAASLKAEAFLVRAKTAEILCKSEAKLGNEATEMAKGKSGNRWCLLEYHPT